MDWRAMAKLKTVFTWGLAAALTVSMLPLLALPPRAEAAEAPSVTALKVVEGAGEALEDGSSQFAREGLDDPYLRIDLAELYRTDRLEVPDGVTAEPRDEGLLLSGTPEALAAGVRLRDALTFGSGKPVGRISVDGLSASGTSAEAGVVLDGAAEPAASVALPAQADAASWEGDGERTADAHGAVPAGTHGVALSLRTGGAPAGVATSLLLRSVEFVQDSLPTVYLDLASDEAATYPEGYGTFEDVMASADHSTRCTGSLSMKVPSGYENEFAPDASSADLEVDGAELEYLRGRGNSTWRENTRKKPFTLKLAKKRDLLGIGANKRWVLLANHFDRSLARDRMTAWLGGRLGMEATPQLAPVDLVVNGIYFGSYLLGRQVRVGENDLNIGEPSAEDRSGGYLLAFDPPYVAQGGVIETRHLMKVQMKGPEYADAETDEQKQEFAEYEAYIRAYLEKAEGAIFGPGFEDADGRSYAEFMDMDSAVKYWWVQQFSQNSDAFLTGSTYLYKKKDSEGGKLYWGPLWDFDYAWGAYGGSMAETLASGKAEWFEQLMGDEAFTDALKACWNDEFRAAVAEMAADGGLLDRYYRETLVSWCYDRERWDTLEPAQAEEPDDDDGYNHGAEPTVTTSLRQEIDVLKAGIKARIADTDASLDVPSSSRVAVSFEADGMTVETLYLRRGDGLRYIPDGPAREGSYFIGWYLPDGTRAEKGTPCDSGLAFTARYIPDGEVTYATELYFAQDSISLFPESEGVGISYVAAPEDALERSVSWTSSDTSVVTVNADGELTARGSGSATVTGVLASGARRSIAVTVMAAEEAQAHRESSAPETFALEPPASSLKVGAYGQVRAAIAPLFTEEHVLRFHVEEGGGEIVGVDEWTGVVRGIAPGTARVQATLFNTRTNQVLEALCKVTVTESDPEPAAKPAAPVLAANPLQVKGKTIKLKAKTLKKKARKVAASKAFKVTGNASGAKLTYRKTSGKAKIKIASNGKITVKRGLKKGTYKLRVSVTQPATSAYKAKTIKKVTVKLKVK